MDPVCRDGAVRSGPWIGRRHGRLTPKVLPPVGTSRSAPKSDGDQWHHVRTTRPAVVTVRQYSRPINRMTALGHSAAATSALEPPRMNSGWREIRAVTSALLASLALAAATVIPVGAADGTALEVRSVPRLRRPKSSRPTRPSFPRPIPRSPRFRAAFRPGRRQTPADRAPDGRSYRWRHHVARLSPRSPPIRPWPLSSRRLPTRPRPSQSRSRST